MWRKVGSIPACAILLIAAAAVGLDAEFAQAQDTCLRAPNGPAPPGSHWYYHTDQATQSKCWSIKPTNQAAHPASVQGQVQQQLREPVQQPAQEQVQEQVQQPVQEQSAPAAAAPLLAVPGSSAWPLPGQQPDAATTAWPAAPSLPTATDTATTVNAPPASPDQLAAPPAPQTPTAESAQPTPPLPTPANPPANQAQDKPAVQPTAPPAGVPATSVTSEPSRLHPIALFAGLLGLLAIGMLLRSAVIRTLGQRRRIKIAPQELVSSSAAKQTRAPVLRNSPRLVPDQTTDHRVSEIEDALRSLAQRQRRRHSAPLGGIPNISSTGARGRS